MTDSSYEEIKQRLQRKDPYEFEELVAELWELQGYETTVRQGSGDRGIDIEATKETPFEQKVLIQAKRYTDVNKVGSEAVRNYATLFQQVPNVDSVVITTTSDFTSEAETLARDLNIKLISGIQLAEMIERYSAQMGDVLDTSSLGEARAETQYDWKDTKSELENGWVDTKNLDAEKINHILNVAAELAYEWRNEDLVQIEYEVDNEQSGRFRNNPSIFLEYNTKDSNKFLPIDPNKYEGNDIIIIIDESCVVADKEDFGGKIESISNVLNCDIVEGEHLISTVEKKQDAIEKGPELIERVLEQQGFDVEDIVTIGINESVW